MIETNGIVSHQASSRNLRRGPLGSTPDFAKPWKDLAATSRRLADIARRQVCEAPFTAADYEFPLAYGKTLGQIMLYEGNSCDTPNDDAPRIADVASDPRTGRTWHVAIDRPCWLYVLYPWNGREILCRGAVLPYHEFAHEGRLDDTRWQAMLDAAKTTPEPPA
ncbi:MAG: DUF3160 domain-containing protein [Planctomycetes bacterium]|nr:DUF3160 domain-containing protein [Planctomycetota bacterium]